MKKWNIFLTALVTLFSCSEEVGFEPKADPVEEEYCEVTFSMQVPGHKKPVVYAASKEDENEITELDILAFAKKSALIDTLAYRITVAKANIPDASDATNGNKKDVKVKFKRSESDLKLVFIANAKSVLDNASIDRGDMFDAIMEKLIYNFSGKWETSPMKAFPMWGQTSGYISVKNPVVSTPIDITLLRSVVKVDVGVDVYGDPAIGFGDRFELRHVYVYNAKAKGSIVPDLSDTGLSSNKVTKPMEPASAGVNTPQVYNITGTKFFNEIYLPESSKSSTDHTCIVIGGAFDGGSETYYRIDFTDNDDKKLDLLRNYRFLVNITNVARDGLSSPDEAFDSGKSSHINYTLGVTDENITSYVYNGQYVLGVSNDNVLLNWDAFPANTISVATDYPEPWSATADVPWIQLFNSGGTMNGSILYGVSRNTDDSNLSRKGTITVTAGSLVHKITVSQSLGANSVIVAPDSLAYIPVLFANADGVERITDATSLQAGLIWQDKTSLISNLSIDGSGKAALIKLTTSGNSGNAVVAVKNNTGTVLWSWHVWVTNYEPDLINSNKQHSGTVFMDRNLGAIGNSGTDRLGLFYQWGRKDPFPGASSINVDMQKTVYNSSGSTVNLAVESVTLPNNFDNAVKNPSTFYTSNEFPWWSWYGLSDADNSLWKDARGGKTAYDPCPLGWRVPVTTGVWSGIGTGNWVFGHTVTPDLGYYPATGSLDFANGEIIDVGRHGYYWSAEPSGARAKAFHIDASGSSIESTPFRASGNPVRCIKE